MRFNFYIFSLHFLFSGIIISHAQDETDAVIMGHVVSGGEHIPFVNIYL